VFATLDASPYPTATTASPDHAGPVQPLRLRSLRAALWLTRRAIQQLGPLEQLSTAFPIIQTFFDDAARVGLNGMTLEAAIAELDRRLEAARGRDPLALMARQLQLHADAITLFMLCVLSEEQPQLAPLFDALGGHDGRPTPSMLADSERSAATLESLLRGGYVVEERVARWRVYSAPAAVVHALHGAAPRGWTLIKHSELPSLSSLILPTGLHEELARDCAALRDTAACWVLRGRPGGGRRALASALAHATGSALLAAPRDATEACLAALPALATLLDAVPLLTLTPAPGERLTLPVLHGYHGWVTVRMPPQGSLVAPHHRLRWQELEMPTRAERAAHWARALGRARVEPTLLQLRVARGEIHRAAASPGMSAERVMADLDAQGRFRLDGIAQHVPAVRAGEQLALDDSLQAEFGALLARCRHRETLVEQLPAAFGHTGAAGVRALFQGPSGTGKTLAARKLAAELGRPLYRVDLASVVSKYIGETERNLERVFEAAETLDVVLLLDEGDALLGRRTDVSNANDRYANMETNFLLQRLESYDGILVVTSNAAERIDQAFARRMDATLDFALPDAQTRRKLWQLHLPVEHTIEETLLDRVAQRCALSGGQIRGAALHATLLGLEAGDSPTNTALLAALRREYRRAGLSCPSLPG
jgi:ATPase family associated with various cellular activities (AAA)